MSNLSTQLQTLAFSIQLNMHFLFLCLAILWGIQIINFGLMYRLNILGILPRDPRGIIGIVLAPMLHGGFNHLFFNCIPLFILANFILIQGQLEFIYITLLITLLSGIAVWLCGRKSLHVGASGLIMGYWGFLFINAITNPSITSIFLVFICFYYFGGFITSLLPTEESVSWESHLFGLIAGVAVDYFQLPYYLNTLVIHYNLLT
jgi:membrane associated rhomboid family serine protease